MKIIITFILACISIIVPAQNDERQFPEDFYGTYLGDLEIVNPQGKQTIPMEFRSRQIASVYMNML
jgi:hypothetical protein